jgi:serine/threonine protein kinase
MHSKAADVYSFGMVLYEILSGSKPYAGMHYAQIVSGITSGRLLASLPAAARHLPPALTSLMSSCLATHAAARPSFAAIRATLESLEKEVAAAPQLPVPVLPPIKKSSSISSSSAARTSAAAAGQQQSSAATLTSNTRGSYGGGVGGVTSDKACDPCTAQICSAVAAAAAESAAAAVAAAAAAAKR